MPRTTADTVEGEKAINNFFLGPMPSASSLALPSPLSGLRILTEITDESSDVIQQNIVGGGGGLEIC